MIEKNNEYLEIIDNAAEDVEYWKSKYSEKKKKLFVLGYSE